MFPKGIESYRRTKVITADSGRLVLMCYEGAIDNLKIVIQKYTENDYEGKALAMKKAIDIVNELLCSLDFEKGGSIARNLESLYTYMMRRMVQADVNKDMEGIREVIGLLSELMVAWDEMISKQKKETMANYAGLREPAAMQSVSYMGA